jgi:hypothetical protein
VAIMGGDGRALLVQEVGEIGGAGDRECELAWECWCRWMGGRLQGLRSGSGSPTFGEMSCPWRPEKETATSLTLHFCSETSRDATHHTLGKCLNADNGTRQHADPPKNALIDAQRNLRSIKAAVGRNIRIHVLFGSSGHSRVPSKPPRQAQQDISAAA